MSLKGKCDEWSSKSGGIEVVCDVLIAAEICYDMNEWFKLEPDELPKALGLMGLPEGKYHLDRRTDEESDHVFGMRAEGKKKYGLKLHRGDMISPYPCWTLVFEDKSSKVFSVEKEAETGELCVEEICAFNSEGTISIQDE